MRRQIGLWFSALLGGLRLSSAWFWAAFFAVGNLFTIASIVWLAVSGNEVRVIAAVVALVGLVVIIAFVLIQAPYRHQLAETETAKRELDEERLEHQNTRDALEHFTDIESQQRDRPAAYLGMSVTNMEFEGIKEDVVPCPSFQVRFENYLMDEVELLSPANLPCQVLLAGQPGALTHQVWVENSDVGVKLGRLQATSVWIRFQIPEPIRELLKESHGTQQRWTFKPQWRFIDSVTQKDFSPNEDSLEYEGTVFIEPDPPQEEEEPEPDVRADTEAPPSGEQTKSPPNWREKIAEGIDGISRFFHGKNR